MTRTSEVGHPRAGSFQRVSRIWVSIPLLHFPHDKQDICTSSRNHLLPPVSQARRKLLPTYVGGCFKSKEPSSCHISLARIITCHLTKSHACA